MNFGQDLYPLLADYGLLATHAQDTLSVGVADSEVASTLGIPAGDAIMLVERLTYGMDKSLLEYRRSTYRCDAGSYRIDIG
jgi:GntR family transcriptional regulator